MFMIMVPQKPHEDCSKEHEHKCLNARNKNFQKVDTDHRKEGKHRQSITRCATQPVCFSGFRDDVPISSSGYP